MRRKPGTLLPLEVEILAVAVEMQRGREREFHGYQAARLLKEREGARLLTAHGTLYKALERLQKGGLLASRWEDPAVAALQERPRRRLYTLTAAGEQAWANAASASAPTTGRLAPGIAGT